jgi:hypothetical protein
MDIGCFSRLYSATLRKIGLRKKIDHVPLRQQIHLRNISQNLEKMASENKEFTLVAETILAQETAKKCWFFSRKRKAKREPLFSLSDVELEKEEKEVLLPIPEEADENLELEKEKEEKEVLLPSPEEADGAKDEKKKICDCDENESTRKKKKDEESVVVINTNTDDEKSTKEEKREKLLAFLPPGLRAKVFVTNFFEHYKLSPHVVGIGVHGKVFSCHENKSGEKFAVKLMECTIENLTSLEHHLSLLPHENILHIEAVYVNQLVDEKFCPFLRYNLNLKEGLHTIIISKLMKGQDLYYQLIETTAINSELVIKKILKKVVQGLCHIHSKGLVHGDMKLENIFCDNYDVADSDVVIADFDFVKDQRQRPRDISFTKAYISPEIIDNITCKRLDLPLSPISSASDMWALGVVLYVLLHRRFPFHDSSPDISVEYAKQVMDARFYVSKTVSKEAKHLLSILLQRKPEFRPTAEQVLQHVFLK